MSEIFRPHPGPQTRFMQWDGRYALYGGAANSGKSQVLLFDPFRQIQVEQERVNRGEIQQSTGRAIFFRRTMPELREMMDRAQRFFDPLGAKWHEQTKTWTFPCGFKYMFGQMEESSDWIKYYGFEFTEILFDELTTFTEEQFEQMDTRLRSSDPVLKKMLYMRAGTNPVGIGLEWVRKRFVECAKPGVPVERHVTVPVYEGNVLVGEKEIVHRQIFIPARVSDNLSADQSEYTATLMTKSSAVKRQLLDGDWYVSAGAFLGDIWDNKVHVCEPFKIPKGWYRFRAADYGYANPASVSWYAVDPDDNFICFRNLTVKGHNATMLAYRIKEIEMEMDLWDIQRGCSKLTGPLDFECWSQRGQSGPTVAQDMMEVGVHWFKCDKNRHAAANQIRSRLVRRTAHPTLLDKAGKPLLTTPGVRWFKTCKDPIRTLPVLPADENDLEVPDTKANDHNYDDLSYACLSRPLRGKVQDEDWYEDDISAAKAKKSNGPRLGQKTGYLW